MPESTVTRFTDTQFRVCVTEGRSETVHEVTLTDTDLQRYGGRAAAERLIQASFEFLLERESLPGRNGEIIVAKELHFYSQ